MNNYYYIISSLPSISPDYRFGEKGPKEIMDEVKSQLSKKDLKVVEFLEKGFDEQSLCEDFYREALSAKDRFIREYFRFDLFKRNAKVRYLNAELGREGEKDVLDVNSDEEKPQIALGEFEQAEALDAALHSADILSRERSIDNLTWEKIDSLTTFDYFDLEAILGFAAKLHIVERWFSLDEKTGREMFRRLVDEVRGTFRGVDFK